MKQIKQLMYGFLLLIFACGIRWTPIFAQQDLSVPNQNGDDYQPDEMVSDFDVGSAYDSLQDLESSVDEIVQQLYDLDAQQKIWDTIPDKYREVRNEIVSVIQTINITSENVSEKLKKVELCKKMIYAASKDLEASRAGFQETKQYLATFANFIYKLDNKLYDDDSQFIDEIKLFINSDNIPRTLANDAMVESLLLQFNDLLDTFMANEQKQLELIKKLNQLKVQAKADIKDYILQLEQLQQKKSYLVQFMALYNKDANQRQLTINSLFDSTKSVYDKIVELSKAIKKWVYTDAFDMEKKMEELVKMADDDQYYPIARPIYPIENIITYFGDIEYQKKHNVPHIGIQIQATQGTPIYNVRDGIVYFVADNDDIGINRVMIVHTDGYVSVYQYLNTSIVKPGDLVKRGQLIWYSGGEPGTRGAGFISKWSNLMFIILKDGIALDPFDILDASIVKDKSVLPDGYQVKYLRDKYARTIDITNLKLMSWATLLQREMQFLENYGVGIYQNVPFREDAVMGTNIDRDVVICIAFAESTLGRYLTTDGNIGNVGNNDRWDRVPFSSAYVGARAIPLTLNNAYLGNYHTINQLSRYGNKDGKIYASSPINRQTNVLKCLSQIKWYYVPEDFPFRIWPNPNLGTGAKETVKFGDALTAEPIE